MHPRLEPPIGTLRDWLPNLFFFLLALLLIEQPLRPWIRNLFARRLRSRDKAAPLTGLRMDLTSGTLSAQPPPPPASAALIPPLPQFVNSNDSTWMLEEYARQQRTAARVATYQTT
jgi:hypothetical protein